MQNIHICAIELIEKKNPFLRAAAFSTENFVRIFHGPVIFCGETFMHIEIKFEKTFG